jgi:hypothetical protein
MAAEEVAADVAVLDFEAAAVVDEVLVALEPQAAAPTVRRAVAARMANRVRRQRRVI